MELTIPLVPIKLFKNKSNADVLIDFYNNESQQMFSDPGYPIADKMIEKAKRIDEVEVAQYLVEFFEH